MSRKCVILAKIMSRKCDNRYEKKDKQLLIGMKKQPNHKPHIIGRAQQVGKNI